ncbi:hypothetical protein IG631_06449 [Alternaria alternata]|nr:hypothetical protein IG631_06449 [Alternaria alternata]
MLFTQKIVRYVLLTCSASCRWLSAVIHAKVYLGIFFNVKDFNFSGSGRSGIPGVVFMDKTQPNIVQNNHPRSCYASYRAATLMHPI